MTSSVRIEAHPVGGKLVKINITSPSETFVNQEITLKNGEVYSGVFYDEITVSAKEVPFEEEPPAGALAETV